MQIFALTLVMNIFSSRHTHNQHFDFDHFARLLNQRDIFTIVHSDDEERRLPHLNLKAFFERLNEAVDAQLAKRDSSKNEEDAEYYPWKKEDIEELTNLAMNDENSRSEDTPQRK